MSADMTYHVCVGFGIFKGPSCIADFEGHHNFGIGKDNGNYYSILG